MRAMGLVLMLALSAGLVAAADPAPPPVPPAPKPVDPVGPLAIQGDTKVPPFKLVKLKAVNVPDKAGLLWKIRPQDPKVKATDLDWASAHNKADIRFVGPPGVYLVELSVAGPAADGSFTLDGTELTVEIQSPTPVDPPPAPPTPPAPGPTPPPTPAKSFRVVLIYESADSLTPAQRAVLYGKAVEDWLTANCTGGAGGWRRRDKDAPGDADPTMAALWAATQPKVTVTPCVAVERDGKVDIIATEATPAKMIEILNSYKGGR